MDRFTLPPDFLYVDCSKIDEPGTYTLPVLSTRVSGLTMTIDPEEVVVHVLLEDNETP